MTGSYLRSAGCSNNHRCSWLNIGSWNLHSLVESEGSAATASTRRGVQVDQKVNLLVRELCRFDKNISKSGLVKVHMRWMVMSCSNLADSCQQMVTLCREMKVLVYTLLNPTMAATWRNAGEFWRAISSRIISIRIQLHGYNSKTLRSRVIKFI